MASDHQEAQAASTRAREQDSHQLATQEGQEDPDQRDEQAHDPTPASPPLPSKHTAATPGPRATRLQEVFASSLKHTLDKISWTNFAACYPTIATHAPGTLQAVQQQMVRLLGEKSSVRWTKMPFFSLFFFFSFRLLPGVCSLGEGMTLRINEEGRRGRRNDKPEAKTEGETVIIHYCKAN